MSTNTNKNPAKQKHDAINAKLLIAAASITLTIGGAVGFLGQQLATSAGVAVEQADASSFTITYMTPVAQATATAVATEPTAPAAEPTTALATEPTAPAAEPTTALVTEPAATVVPTIEPTAIPTAVPTAEPTVQPTAAQPLFVARSRSSR